MVRYKQTVIGIAWSVIRPLLTMVVFTVVFGRIAQFPSGGVPYPLLVLAGLLPWQLVATSMADVSASLISNSTLLTKVYFPRLTIPVSTVVTAVVDFAISLAILVAMMAYYAFMPPVQILLLPLFVLLAIAFSLGVGLVFCALNVRYRDFRYIIPFLLQLGLYISPVGFSSAAIPESWRLLYSLNPVVGIINGFRWAILGGEHQIHLIELLSSALVSGLILWYGIVVFRRTERTFADIV